MAGIKRDKTREKETPEVDIVSPYGAEITVGRKRAEALLKRPAVRFGDGKLRKYALPGEDTLVPEAESVSKAPAPRAGTRGNTGTGGE